MGDSSNAGGKAGRPEQEDNKEEELFPLGSPSYTPQMFMKDLKKRLRMPADDEMYDYYDCLRRYPLHHAAACGRVDILRFMLDKGYDIDALDEERRTPLQQAAIMSGVASTEALIAAGADIRFRCSRKGMTALDCAASYGSVRVAKVLIEHGVNINAAGVDGTALHHAATTQSEKMSLFLLANGADVDAVDSRGCTPLHRVIIWRDLTLTRALLAAGADVTIRCREGKSALDWAASRRSADVAKAIINYGVEHGMDVNAEGSAGRTAVHVAAKFNLAGVVDMVVKAGANIERGDNGGNTPLHIALCRSSFAAAVALLNLGASVSTRNRHGYSPLHFAAAVAGPPGTKKIVDLMLRHGADEKAVAINGKTAADVVGVRVHGWNTRMAEVEAEAVRKLLANAPADRAWRRRGFLVLCRAHYPIGRVQLGEGVVRTRDNSIARRTRSHAKPSRAEIEWGGVASMLMGAGADPISRMGDGADFIFKMIVGYL